MLDEVNLFYQLLNHYCISWASNDESDTGKIDYRVYTELLPEKHLPMTSDKKYNSTG